MAFKTYAGLATTVTVLDADLLATYSGTGPLKSTTAAIFAAYVGTKLTGTYGVLASANTWAAKQTISINTATSAADYFALVPTDAGVGKPSLLFSKEATALNWQLRLYDGTTVAGQLDVGLTLLNLTGALTVSGLGTFGSLSVTGAAAVGGALTVTGAATFSGGVTQTGGTKQNVTAAAALNLDLSTSDLFTKSISSNSAFTFSNLPASGGGFALLLTISSAAVPSWPASVKWDHSTDPSSSLGNGTHTLGFITFDGGTTWTGMVGSIARG